MIYQNIINVWIKQLNLFCSRISSRHMFDEFVSLHRDEVAHQNQSNSEILARFSSKKFHDDKEERKSEVRLSWWRILERTSHWWFSVGSPQLWSPDSVVGSVQIFPTFQQNTFCFTWELRGELGGGAEGAGGGTDTAIHSHSCLSWLNFLWFSLSLTSSSSTTCFKTTWDCSDCFHKHKSNNIES